MKITEILSLRIRNHNDTYSTDSYRDWRSKLAYVEVSDKPWILEEIPTRTPKTKSEANLKITPIKHHNIQQQKACQLTSLENGVC